MPAPPRVPYPAPRFDPLADVSEPDGIEFIGTDFTDVHADGSRFLDCTFQGCKLSGATFHEARFVECQVRSAHGVRLSFDAAVLADTTFVDCRWGVVSAGGSQWRDVTVTGGKIDFLNLRGAQLNRVGFRDVVITDLDLGEASLDTVTFDGCTLERPEFGRATLARVDLRGASVREPSGIGSLKGATMSRTQVLELAEWFATELGVRVED